PGFSGFKPYGLSGGTRGKVELYYEEYEALRLADYELYTYEEASVLMGVSRATFARICESARSKMAKALVEGREIVAIYGNVYLEREWFFCNDCKTRFDIYETEEHPSCPVCRSSNIGALKAYS
ncbi:MAG: DUF134 domain-containing protein, partial [Bacteroidales bacterium]|nr:DUF134 domain-containing protein [Bacteroidales bacterium]